MEGREISKAVITRLPRYYRYLGELMELGVERISSNELSSRMKVTASQIRQDLNNFGGFGQQGYGYNVKYLYNEIGKILGIDRKHNLIIIAAICTLLSRINCSRSSTPRISMPRTTSPIRRGLISNIPLIINPRFSKLA